MVTDKIHRLPALAFTVISLAGCYLSLHATNDSLFKGHEDSPMAAFAAGHIRKSIERVDLTKPKAVRFVIDSTLAGEQAFVIDPWGTEIVVTGGDEAGLMYGGLELAEFIKLHKSIPQDRLADSPYLKRRGIKMNIPLDARTPSYDDSGTAAIRNTAHVWDIGFWHEYLDRMATYRYNTLTLWNPHPFPSMIRQEKYPDVALDDVYITTLTPVGIENEWGEPQLVSRNVLENLERVKRMSIDDKIAHWKEVMRYARDRGIDIYFITWNICPNSVAQPVPAFYRTYGVPIWDEPEGKYGVTHQINDPDTIAYMRDAVKTFLLTYPDLKGIGVTAGEHMPHHRSEYSGEEWLWNTYGLGILDAKKQQPDREVPFIHRFWNTDIDHILDYWKQYPDPFSFSMKYAKARLYSTPVPPFADNNIRRMKPHGLKSWWNLRNDDIFVHRWGDPDYVREFLTNFDMEATIGYHMGSDGYVWGRDFVSKDPEVNGSLEFDKHWYKFMLWGRLGYNPGLGKEFWIGQIKDRFPKADAVSLYKAWQSASRIIPEVNRYHWRDWDHMWSVEASTAHIGGFRDVFDFVTNPTLQGSGMLSPRDYVGAIRQMRSDLGSTPLDVAANLQGHADAAMTLVDNLRREKASSTLEHTVSDIESMCWLGRYYSNKILAAVEIAWFQQTGYVQHKEEAISLMEIALKCWERYADICNQRYYPQHLARTKTLDWDLLTREVEKELQLVKQMKN